MSHTVTVRATRTTRTGGLIGPSPSVLCNCGYLATAHGITQVAEVVLGAVCVGVAGYYGNEYYYDVGAQAVEWVTLLFKTNQLDVWKPVIFFVLAATVFLFNTLCLLISCILSFSTASMIHKTIYGILYHMLAFILYLAASITLMVSLNKRNIKDYRDGYYYEPFMASGIIGVIISCFYLLNTFLSYRSYRETV